MKSGIASALVLAACGGHPRASTPTSTRATATASTEAVDAGVLGLCQPEGTEAKDAAPCIEECNRGLASSCELLADRAMTGAGVPRDPTRALSLHERACELRDAAACVTAARMHGAGRGVAPNRKRQLDLLVSACNLGNATSCASAARAFATGAGVPKDEAHARALWQRACLGGDEASCEEAEDAGAGRP